MKQSDYTMIQVGKWCLTVALDWWAGAILIKTVKLAELRKMKSTASIVSPNVKSD